MELLSHYQVLEVKSDFTFKELRSAYLELSRKWHPDRNPADPSAKSTFQQIQTAYEVLSDPEKRSEYDQSLEEGLNMGSESLESTLARLSAGGASITITRSSNVDSRTQKRRPSASRGGKQQRGRGSIRGGRQDYSNRPQWGNTPRRDFTEPQREREPESVPTPTVDSWHSVHNEPIISETPDTCSTPMDVSYPTSDIVANLDSQPVTPLCSVPTQSTDEQVTVTHPTSLEIEITQLPPPSSSAEVQVPTSNPFVELLQDAIRVSDLFMHIEDEYARCGLVYAQPMKKLLSGNKQYDCWLELVERSLTLFCQQPQNDRVLLCVLKSCIGLSYHDAEVAWTRFTSSEQIPLYISSSSSPAILSNLCILLGRCMVALDLPRIRDVLNFKYLDTLMERKTILSQVDWKFLLLWVMTPLLDKARKDENNGNLLVEYPILQQIADSAVEVCPTLPQKTKSLMPELFPAAC